MKLELTGKEWKTVILSLAAVRANTSYNALRQVLMSYDIGELSDGALGTIGDDEVHTVDISDSAGGLAVITQALGEQPAKAVISLLTKLSSLQQSAGSRPLHTHKEETNEKH